MISSRTVKTEDLVADIVVIGGGGAGLAAARAAAEKGAGVVVLDKRGLGGSSAMSFGIFAVESPVQQRQNIASSKDDYFKQTIEYYQWRVNPRILRTFIDKSGDTIRWLEEKGMEFMLFADGDIPKEEQKVLTWHVPPTGGVEIIQSLAKTCRELGVQILLHTPARKILTSANGEITGVLAKAKGTAITIKTKSVIIATGGFGGNRRWLKKYCPEYRDNMVCLGQLNMGDGLAMATGIGAGTDGLGQLLLSGPVYMHDIYYDFTPGPDPIRLPLEGGSHQPNMLWVNKRGERFIDESVGHHHVFDHAIARQPDGFVYSLMDQTLLEKIGERYSHSPGPGKIKAGPRRLFGQEAEANKDPVKVADSLTEMAKWIGADPEVLIATVAEYNAVCDKGFDDVFMKAPQYLIPLRTPPFYAIRWHASFQNTIGGIKINEHFEVLDKLDKPLPGVYAAGVDTGGWETETHYPKLTGHAFGYAVNSGRIAGENAAEFVNVSK